jgi:hypothetical protein
MGWTFYNASGQRLSTSATSITNLDIDGATDIGEAIVDADLFIVDNGAGGTNRKTAASRIKTYVGAAPSQAVEADLEAETNQDTYAPPDLIKHSPGVAKAWAQIEQAGAHSSPIDYNCDSFTDGGQLGQTDIVFGTDFSGADYVMSGSVGETAAVCTDFGSHAAGSITTATMNLSDGSRVDNNTYVTFFGNQ